MRQETRKSASLLYGQLSLSTQNSVTSFNHQNNSPNLAPGDFLFIRNKFHSQKNEDLSPVKECRRESPRFLSSSRKCSQGILQCGHIGAFSDLPGEGLTEQDLFQMVDSAECAFQLVVKLKVRFPQTPAAYSWQPPAPQTPSICFQNISHPLSDFLTHSIPAPPQCPPLPAQSHMATPSHVVPSFPFSMRESLGCFPFGPNTGAGHTSLPLTGSVPAMWPPSQFLF